MSELTSALQADEQSGFEFYRFEISRSGVHALLRKAGDNSERFKELMASYYLKERRPSVGEISDVRIEDASPSMYSVTFVIRRGHWEIAAFLRSAPLPIVCMIEGELVFFSEGKPMKKLPLSSLPSRAR